MIKMAKVVNGVLAVFRLMRKTEAMEMKPRGVEEAKYDTCTKCPSQPGEEVEEGWLS
jgi:hypothetical protein